MVEIKKIQLGSIFEESEEPLILYMFNNTEIALIHFLERELGENLSLPTYLQSSFAEAIMTDESESRYMINDFEGYVARRVSLEDYR